MRSFHTFTIPLLAAILTTSAAFAAEGEGAGDKAPADKAWVQQKVQTCAGCHGQKGVPQIANYPTLAGQYKSYLVHALKSYRDGKRQNPIMGPQAQSLTDAQIEALAAYYSHLESPLHTPALER